MILFLVGIEFFQIISISRLKELETMVNAEKQQYSDILNDIKKIEEEKKTLLTRIDVIRTLKRSSSLTVHAMDEIANFIPVGRMWLKNLSQTENKLTIGGMALDDQTIAKYLEDLESSRYVQNVRLVNSSMEIYAGRSLKAFSISAQVAIPK